MGSQHGHVLQGRKAVWEKLSAIRANCAIEVTMDKCLKKVSIKSYAATLSVEDHCWVGSPYGCSFVGW